MDIHKEGIIAIHQLIRKTCTDRVALFQELLVNRGHVRAHLTSHSSSPVSSPTLQAVHLAFLNVEVHLKLH